MTTTTKIDKKDLKAPDEFVTWGARATQYVAENAVLVIGGTLGVLVLVALVVGWMQGRDAREREAAGKLFAGEKLLGGSDSTARMFGMAIPGSVSDEDRKKAVEAFEKVASDYAGTATARRARLLAGDTKANLGDHDGAIAAYQGALEGARPLERFYARNGIGHAQESKGALEEAARTYRELMEDESLAMRDVAALDLARVLHRGGKTDEARTVLAKFPETFPESALKEDAERELTRLGGSPAAPAAESSAAPSTGEGAVSAAPGP